MSGTSNIVGNQYYLVSIHSHIVKGFLTIDFTLYEWSAKGISRFIHIEGEWSWRKVLEDANLMIFLPHVSRWPKNKHHIFTCNFVLMVHHVFLTFVAPQLVLPHLTLPLLSPFSLFGPHQVPPYSLVLH